MANPVPSTTLTPRRKLELSQLGAIALAESFMGEDVDIEDFVLYLNSIVQVDVRDRIIDGRVSLTMEGASTIEFDLDDYDGTLLTSGLITKKLDIQIDGLWWRLLGADFEDDMITLQFENREVSVLREYNSWKVARRSKTTRDEFVLNLLREPVEFKSDLIPAVIPQLRRIMPIERYNGDNIGHDKIKQKGKGLAGSYIPKGSVWTPPGLWTSHARWGSGLLVKKEVMDQTQRDNINVVLDVGTALGVPRKYLVIAIMVVIQENDARVDPDNAHRTDKRGGNPCGMFEQMDSWRGDKKLTGLDGHGMSVADSLDIETSARSFYKVLAKRDAERNFVEVPYYELAEDTQASGQPLLYKQWQDHAEKIVTAYGEPDTSKTGGSVLPLNGQGQNTTTSGEYFFYRGVVKDIKGHPTRKKENTWDCFNRLADEVDKKSFFANGVFYFIGEEILIKQQPRLIVNDKHMDGLTGFRGSCKANAKKAQLELTVICGKWSLPQGSVVVLQDMGLLSGRWLVDEFARSFFEKTATITLVKDRPELPEPLPSTTGAQGILTSWLDQPSSPAANTNPAEFGGIPGANSGDRNSIVKIAYRALKVQQTKPYAYAHPRDGKGRPYPPSLWSDAAHGDQKKSTGLDCSSFVTLVYKTAGVKDDPNGTAEAGYGYNGQAWTVAEWNNPAAIPVSSPEPGDLAFSHPKANGPDHVGIYVGNHQVINIGGPEGIRIQTLGTAAGQFNAFAGPGTGFRSYLPWGTSVAKTKTKKSVLQAPDTSSPNYSSPAADKKWMTVEAWKPGMYVPVRSEVSDKAAWDAWATRTNGGRKPG